FVDDGRIIHDLVVVDEDGDLAIGVEAEEFRRALLTLAEIDVDALELEVFLSQNHSNLLRKWAVSIVVQLEHRRCLLPADTVGHITRIRNDFAAKSGGFSTDTTIPGGQAPDSKALWDVGPGVVRAAHEGPGLHVTKS